MRFLFLGLVACSSALFACANGSSVASTYSDGQGGYGGYGGGGPSSSQSSGHTSSHSSTTSSTGVGGDPSTSSVGGSGGGSSCDFTAPETCPSAQELPSIDGDQNNDVRVIQGTTARWLKIKINEAVSSI